MICKAAFQNPSLGGSREWLLSQLHPQPPPPSQGSWGPSQHFQFSTNRQLKPAVASWPAGAVLIFSLNPFKWLLRL